MAQPSYDKTLTIEPQNHGPISAEKLDNLY